MHYIRIQVSNRMILRKMHINATTIVLVIAILILLILIATQKSSTNYTVIKQSCAGADCLTYQEMRHVYTEQGPRRAAEVRQSMLIGDEATQYQYLYNALVPEVLCPSLIRVGRVGDGGKWMCRPHALPNSCAIYSLGVNSETSFEHEIQSITDKRCKLYAFDQNQASLPSIEDFSKINAKFIKAVISDVDDTASNKRTMASIMRENGDDVIEVLKIDIEGGELTVMPLLLESVNMCQILVEIHYSPKDTVPLFKIFAKYRYRLFSYEINGMWHKLSEYSFIREDCLERYSALPLHYYLDSV